MTELNINRRFETAESRLDQAFEPSGAVPRFRRILAPVDFSASTAEVFRYARACAPDGGTMIHVLHVVALNLAGEEAGIPRTGLIRAMSGSALQELHKLVNLFWSEDLPVTVEVRAGRPDEIILETARATQADLIILGRRSQPRFSDLWRRGVAARVLGAAPSPVLIVRGDAGHATRPRQRDATRTLLAE